MAIIGIPAALMFYRFLPYWRALFELNGHTILISRPPKEGFLEQRRMPGPSDLCLPVKLMLLHSADLIDRCDFVFVPRLVSLEKKTYNCPHFLGIPDVIRAQYKREIRILDPTLDVRNQKKPNESFYRELTKSLGGRTRPFAEVHPAAMNQYSKAMRRFPAFTEPTFFRQIDRRDARFVIGLVGRPYILFEPELGGRLLSYFRQEKIFLVTPEMIRADLKERTLESLKRPVYWYNGRQNLGAAFNLLQNPRIDGLIQVVTFGCGPDSLMKEMIDQYAGEVRSKPYLSLVLDQHARFEGIQTRLEAFLDMMERKRQLTNRRTQPTPSLGNE